MKLRMVFAAAAVAAMLGTASAQSVGIATSNPGSVFHSSGTALAKVANEKASLAATVQPYASPNVFIPGINAGELQFGFGSVVEGTFAYEGQEYFSGRPQKDLRAVAITYPIRNGIFVKKDSPYHRVSDLKGHLAPDGMPSQKVVLHIMDAIYATGGISRTEMKPINVPNVVAGGDAFAAGKVDWFTFAIGGAKIREVDASVGGLRCLSVPNTPEALSAAQKYLPGSYIRLVKPGPDSPGVTEPVYVVTYDGLLYASAKTPDDVVYRMTKAMYENKAELAATFPVYQLFEPKEMVKKIAVPYHPGAIKFYKEKGFWPPK